MWDLAPSIAAAAGSALLGLVSVVVGRTLLARRRHYVFSPADLSSADLTAEDLQGSEQRLAGGLAIPTISVSHDAPPPKKELLDYHKHLRESFPTVFNSPLVTVEIVNELSLLLTVHGSRSELRPYLLLSHMDVVPVNEERWNHPPFGGLIKDGFIIGRGAIDVKQTTHAILESLEHRLKTGDAPKRSLFVALGHDEEINGTRGAKEIGKLLGERGAQPLFIIDEGTAILDRFMPGVRSLVGVVGVCEKGYLSVEVTARGEAGHSSIPPPETAVGRLGHALARLHPNPQPLLLGRGPEMELIQLAGAVAKGPFRFVYANFWLFKGLIQKAFLKNRAMQATIQTSTAVTIIKGGYKENVVPGEATAVINHRVSPLMDRDAVIAVDRAAMRDPSLELKVLRESAPSPIAPYGEEDGPFGLIGATLQQMYGDEAMAVPGVMIANTDTRHYLELTDHVYRFNPIVLRPDQLGMYHGDNEMIAVDNYHHCVRFYYRLMKNSESDAAVAKMP
ncbi:N-fatty-acyl-amino acid synthase/hydrolase PM20D1 [Amphibalanus amphitrite]|uniref:N-fatty-acyl-amino acid synthase/hydrolase PM20D1 n=1 Tax=Amphibalanus amphitrite TaxID=1232801 RepID=A0A6A4WFA4_AMPAM|nr:N-fatty-acyl-amino acid synthase/hydrolase PM20D1-like [Amphibalanus amphitrite]KAF0302320.1 N-fatty-acyl-amino acid synthase/hydrolase PM20D1 [Amphibalanus amphitrite]